MSVSIRGNAFSGDMLFPVKLLCFTDYDKGAFGNLDKHDSYQVVLVEEGKFAFQHPNGSKLEIGKYEIGVVPPGLEHTWHNAGESLCRTMMFLLYPLLPEDYGVIADVFSVRRKSWFLSSPSHEKVKKQFDQLLFFCQNPSPFSGIRINATLLNLLADIAENSRNSGDKSIDRELDVVAKALEYISKNYRNKITLGELSSMCYLGPSRFSELFRKRIGKSPIAYIHEYRLHKAEILLYYSQYSITHIAEYLGFRSVHYFSRSFRDFFGKPPSAYRRIS